MALAFLRAFVPTKQTLAPVFSAWKTMFAVYSIPAKILHLNIPYTEEEVSEAIREVVRVNNLKEAYIRPLVFLGSEGMGLRAEGLKVHLGIAALGVAILHLA
jgi:hypothetical protein